MKNLYNILRVNIKIKNDQKFVELLMKNNETTKNLTYGRNKQFCCGNIFLNV